MWVTAILIIVGVLIAAALVFWLVGERGHPMRRSTWRGLRAQGLRNLLNFKALHQYIYGRWTNQYIKYYLGWLFRHMNPRRAKRLMDHYHGKVLTHDHAEAIVNLDHDIPLRDLEQIVPYATARDLVLSASPDIAVLECCCRHARAEPCQPTQVCMAVGQPFVDFLLEHRPHDSRRLTQAEALELLDQEHERGHVHSAFFKDVMLNRFYAICNCCKCCCGSIEATVRQGVPMMTSSGYVAELNSELCKGCGVCVDACPFDALSKGDKCAVLNWDKCMGCGVCVDRCRQSALALARDEKKGVPLDVRAMS